jgi:tripartite-type tricarboxylate transporter receptor subunit TctC
MVMTIGIRKKNYLKFGLSLSIAKTLAVITSSLIATLTSPISVAESYPNRPVRVIVGYVAGGAVDTIARYVSESLTKSLGQQFIVDNRAGAAGTIAAQIAKESKPDGHTIFYTTITQLAVANALKRSLPYDPVNDFSPITVTATTPFVLLMHPSVGNSLKDLINLARSQPGKLAFGTPGIGTSPHLAMEYFASLAKLDMLHVPFKGGSHSVIALQAGEVQLTFLTALFASTYVREGKLKGVAVTSLKRLMNYPDLPTLAESGFANGYEVTGWNGLVAPARTPQSVIDLLYRETSQIVRNPAMKNLLSESMTVDGKYDPIIGIAPTEFAQHIKNEIKKWKTVAVNAKIQPQ